MNIGRTFAHIVVGAGVTVGLSIAMLGASNAEPMQQLPQPQAKAATRLTPAGIKLKINKGGIQAAFDKFAGVVATKCPAAAAAQTALATCKETCTATAANAGITPAELARCGDMPADDCATSIMEARAAACMSTAGAAGCLDQAKALDQANEACADCAQSATNVAAANRAVILAEARLAAAQALAARAQNTLAAAKARQTAACQAAK
jgi:hypothetical protein